MVGILRTVRRVVQSTWRHNASQQIANCTALLALEEMLISMYLTAAKWTSFYIFYYWFITRLGAFFCAFLSVVVIFRSPT